MPENEKQAYILGLKKYHRRLQDLLKDEYSIDTGYFETLSWGYHTTAFYIKATDGKEYTLRMADWSRQKKEGTNKDVGLSLRLKSVIPTPDYIKDKTGLYCQRFEDKIVRLSHFISGLAPLDLTYDVLDQMTDVLKKIHRFVPANDKGEVLLHGDLTPHNVLVSFDKLVAVMDFELSFTGPREYDLARMTVFCWNYLKGEEFENVAGHILKTYNNTTLNLDLFYKYVVENAKKHLEAVERHREDYDRPQDWEKDRDFASAQLKRLILLKV